MSIKLCKDDVKTFTSLGNLGISGATEIGIDGELKDTLISIVAIVCIAFIECFAIYKGLNSVGFATALAVIAGIAGFKLNDILSIKPAISRRIK